MNRKNGNTLISGNQVGGPILFRAVLQTVRAAEPIPSKSTADTLISEGQSLGAGGTSGLVTRHGARKAP